MSNAPRLVLLPGLNGDGGLFAPLLAELPAWLQVVVLPLPETGAQNHAGLAAALRPQLERLEGPLVLLGESFSGALAHRLCRELNQPPRGLILASSFLQRPRRLLPSGALMASLRGLLQRRWLIARFCADQHAAPALLDLISQQIRRLPGPLLVARLDALRRMQPQQAVVALPTLQLAARQDRLVSPAASRAVARHCSALQRMEINGPHFLLQCRPRDCAQAIEGFIAGLTSRALP